MSKFEVKTKVFIGNNSIYNVKKLNVKNIFIICDKFIIDSGLINDFLTDIKNDRINYEVFSDILPDTPLEVVVSGVKRINDFRPDCILAIGGGSTIDAGKAINLMYSKITEREPIIFIAVPTTSGTGSEVTNFSVVFDAEKKVKYPLVDEMLLPDYAILDANLVKTVPLKITIDTAIDTLTHSIESYVSVNRNDFSDALVEKAVKIIFEYLPIVCKDLMNDEARQKIHNASCMAGMAFNLTNLGLNHSMAHTFGAHFHIPHGRANAVLMPYIIAFNAGIGIYNNKDDETCIRYAKIAKLLNKVDSENISGARILLQTIIRFLSSLGIEKDLKSLGISEVEFKDNLDDMVESALNDGCLIANPRKCSREDIKSVFLNAYYGKI